MHGSKLIDTDASVVVNLVTDTEGLHRWLLQTAPYPIDEPRLS